MASKRIELASAKRAAIPKILRQEFQLLLAKVRTDSQSPASQGEIMQQTMQFFEKVHRALACANEEEKAAIYDVLLEMYKTLQSGFRQLTTDLGMDAQQTKAFLANPNNFSVQQWQLIQEGRSRLLEISQPPSSPKAEAPPTQETTPQTAPSKTKGSSPSERHMKQKWKKG